VKKVDIFVGFLLIILSVSAWMTSNQLPSVGDTDVGPGFFPRLVAAVLILLSAMLIVSAFRRQPDAVEKGPSDWKKPLLGMALTFVYLALVYGLGFYVSTPVFLLGFIWLFGYRKPAAIGAVAVLVTLFVYLTFENVLQVPLPAGVFFE
jgi:putative tricarboxylic transport membrane protein